MIFRFAILPSFGEVAALFGFLHYPYRSLGSQSLQVGLGKTDFVSPLFFPP